MTNKTGIIPSIDGIKLCLVDTVACSNNGDAGKGISVGWNTSDTGFVAFNDS
jgi:hypothetical protein